MPVMVFGDPYAEDAEDRRRIRYAVMSALGAARLAPQYSRHIGFFYESGGSPVPFEWAYDPRFRDRRVLILWLDENLLGRGLRQSEASKQPSGADLERPLDVLRGLMDDLGLCTTSDGATRDAKIRVRLLGPQGSNALLQIVRQIQDMPDSLPDNSMA
jgi:hypothetical protein